MQADSETKIIIDILRAELQLQRRHTQILQEQHQALLVGDRAWFAMTQRLYIQYLADAKRHADLRLKVLGPPTVPLKKRMSGWSPRERTAGFALVDAIRALIENVRLLGRSNAAMIENELRYGKFMLDLYLEATRKQSNYAKRGLQPIRSANLLINQVA
jgi:hypothetical protein